jgi:hypothetical protein
VCIARLNEKLFVSSNFRPEGVNSGTRSVCTTFTEALHPKSVDGESTAPGWALGGVPGEIERPALMRGFFWLCGEHGSYFRAAESFAKLHGDRSVTTNAKGSNVIEVALAASFCYGQNVIGIP